MPIISRFFGIIIFMFWRDHNPPHFHAKYGDDEVVIEIESGKVSGSMSTRALILVQEWRKLYKEELMRDWELAEKQKALFPINLNKAFTTEATEFFLCVLKNLKTKTKEKILTNEVTEIKRFPYFLFVINQYVSLRTLWLTAVFRIKPLE